MTRFVLVSILGLVGKENLVLCMGLSVPAGDGCPEIKWIKSSVQFEGVL